MQWQRVEHGGGLQEGLPVTSAGRWLRVKLVDVAAETWMVVTDTQNMYSVSAGDVSGRWGVR